MTQLSSDSVDRVQRNAEVRDLVVRHLYAHGPAPDLAPVLEPHRIGGRDLGEALRYLEAKGLVTGVWALGGSMLHVELTDDGIDCAERFGGVVTDFQANKHGGTTVNFHGSVSGNVAWDNRQVSQHSSTTSSGLAGDELATLLTALRQALPVLGVDEADAGRIQGQLEVAEDELASDRPDETVVRSVVRRTLDKIGEVGSTSLGLVLTAYAKDLMHRAGIPLE